MLVAFALFSLAGFEMNQPVAPKPDQQTLRVATWNVYGFTQERQVVQERGMRIRNDEGRLGKLDARGWEHFRGKL